jgi:hypothetical protein
MTIPVEGQIVPTLPGQTALLLKLDTQRGMTVTQPALQRAQGLLSRLPAVMMSGEISPNVDGSLAMQWVRKDDELDVDLRLKCLPFGGVQYAYIVKGSDGGQAGGILKPHQSDDEVIWIVRHVVAMLTPKPRPANPALPN